MREEFIHSQLSSITLSYLATESSRLRDEDVYFRQTGCTRVDIVQYSPGYSTDAVH
jgi:hypothetical protein